MLVADDDPGSREGLTSLLALEGFLTVPVDCGQRALDCIRAFRDWPTDSANSSLVDSSSVDSGPDFSGPESSRAGHHQRADDEIDFLVLDYNMPDLTGLEVLRRIHRYRIALPTIMVTGQFTNELERIVLREGGFALVPKPIKLDYFRELVWELVHTRLQLGE